MNQTLPDSQSAGPDTSALHSKSGEHLARYCRVMAYEFDAPGAPLPYSRRLSEREGWSAEYAAQVIEEYRHFVFLAVSMEHVATSSKAVDAAWHLHLQYTREYWDVFCTQVLRSRLHHSPGTGAPDEPAMYAKLYAQMLDSYRRVFRVEPPEEIWPSPGASGEDDPLPRRVIVCTSSANRPRGGRIAWLTAMAAIFATCAYAGDFNVFDYAGPAFLGFYVTLCACVLLLIFGMRRLTYQLSPWGASADLRTAYDAWQRLTPEEAALLTGGAARMAQVATIRLMQAGAIHLAADSWHSSHVEAIDAGGTGRFRAEWEWSRSRLDRHTSFHTFCRQLMMRRPAMVGELAARGWLWEQHGMRVTQFANCLLVLLVLATGFAKLLIGVSRDRPVLLLVATMIVFGVACFFLTSRSVGSVAQV